VLALSAALREAMIAHARAALPNEACGLIAGHTDDAAGFRHIEKVYLLTNTDHSPEHFNIDPAEQLQAVKDMRSSGLEPLGNFHSHPATPARMSEEDKRLAHDPKAAYLILSLAADPPVLKAFAIANGEPVSQEVQVVAW